MHSASYSNGEKTAFFTTSTPTKREHGGGKDADSAGALGLATGASLIRLAVAPVAPNGTHSLKVTGLDPGVVLGLVADPSDEVLKVAPGTVMVDDDVDLGDGVGVDVWWQGRLEGDRRKLAWELYAG